MAINKQRALDEFFELVKMPCPSGSERPAADYLIAALKDLGADEVIEDEKSREIIGDTGNVLAYFKGNVPGAKVMLVGAHMDCVPNCIGIKPQIVDGVIKSDGTTVLGGDDKSGVVAIMETLRCLKEQNIPHGDIQVLFTVAEEQGLLGSKNLDASLLKADYGLILDSSGRPGKIICSAPGQYKITAKIYGKTAHGGVAPEKGINAIKKAAYILTGVPTGRLDEETTCNIGIINGGTATNVVPDLVEVQMDCRSRDNAKLLKLVDRLKNAFLDGGAKIECRVEVEATHSYDAYNLDKETPCIKLAAEAAAEIGLDVLITGTGGGSDASLINTLGIPCTVLGTGMTNVHTTEEILIEQDLYDICELLLTIVKNSVK